MDMEVANDVEVSKEENEETMKGIHDLEEMKRRIKEMEDESTALQKLQAKWRRWPALYMMMRLLKVDYSCTLEEVQQHFETCGTVKRVTIRSDKYDQPKVYAHVEFLETVAYKREAKALKMQHYECIQGQAH